MKKLMIMESSPKILDILCFAVEREGYSIVHTNDGLDGLSILDQCSVDLIILDLAPPMDSIETYRCLREEGILTPILIFVRKDEDTNDAVWGDVDYISKPFSMQHLLMKIKEKTRYSQVERSRLPIPSKLKTMGRITIDPYRSVIQKDGVPLDLTQREYDIMIYLSSQPGKIFSREDLLHQVWDYPGYVGTVRGVDVAIRRLREKIEDDPASPAIILTKRGCGYFLNI